MAGPGCASGAVPTLTVAEHLRLQSYVFLPFLPGDCAIMCPTRHFLTKTTGGETTLKTGHVVQPFASDKCKLQVQRLTRICFRLGANRSRGGFS